MATEPELRAHQEWLGFVQPVGLVVSPAALLATQTYVQRNIIPQQQILQGLVREEKIAIGPEGEKEARPVLPDLPEFCIQFLGWRNTDIIGFEGAAQIPDTLKVSLADYGETLAPTYAVPDPDQNGAWVLLIQILKRGTDLDSAAKQDDRHWHATPQARFERLLRETKVPIGLLFNHTEIRLVYTPSGESTGYLTFPIKAMCEVAGRPIAAALHMLLSAERLFTIETARRLPAILRESRKYQNEVSTALAEQVLAALNELLRGFQAANEASKNVLLGEVLASDPNHVYGGLLTSLMRLVFILYAEDRGLLSSESVYVNSYSVEGLFERLREDAARYPDNMDGRYGAWAQLLTLFRLVYDGAKHGAMRLPARHGKLFDPDAYPFLEGRPYRSQRVLGERLKPPRLSDGVIYRVLTNLLLLKGEQLSYRALDVEQIGSVYEAMMGYELLVATGPSVGLRPDNVVLSLDLLLGTKAEDRPKRLREIAGCELTGQALEHLKSAQKTEELLAALAKKISGLTAYVVPKGGMFLQPTDERRRSGSDYTPRSLTEPIVRTTLRPIFERLGEHPKPEQILDLKICDPAMGSGAFLVEGCRFLGDKLVEAWNHYKELPAIPPDEDPNLYARRLVAQRCLYGVDINPFAVDLAKLSLWLATLAKDHPFTFLDHALRSGDSLVGFDRVQIAQFHWDKSRAHGRVFGQDILEKSIERVTRYRKEIMEMAEDNVASILLKHQKLGLADDALQFARRAGDLLAAAFFNSLKDKEREKLLGEYRNLFLSESRKSAEALREESEIVDQLRRGKLARLPFHWEIEFPEVFDRNNPGFDVVIGNPPFFWGNRISRFYGDAYRDWLLSTNEDSLGNADLVVYFFRRALRIIREGGTFGLIATNSISEADTRATGLDFIVRKGATIFEARNNLEWPGQAGVRVSVVHAFKGDWAGGCLLDGLKVPAISSDLRPGQVGGPSRFGQPTRLLANRNKCFKGVDFGGEGFLLLDEEFEIIRKSHPKEMEFVQPVLNSQEFSSLPSDNPKRHIINFGGRPLSEARKAPYCLGIVETRVKPMRDQKKGAEKTNWWQFRRSGEAYMEAVSGLTRVLLGPVVAKFLTFRFFPHGVVFTNALNIFAFDSYSAFAVLQSRVHQLWALRFASTLRTDTRYNASDCFETFPFCEGWESTVSIERIGRTYYDLREHLLATRNKGLTEIYNCFHDPEVGDVEIDELRKLHSEMDQAVLDAYGWNDIQPKCEFILNEIDEETDDFDKNRRMKPWRLRWPDETHDVVFDRLLRLNVVRVEDEQLSGALADPGSRPSSRRGKGHGRKDLVSGTGNLLAGLVDGKKL